MDSTITTNILGNLKVKPSETDVNKDGFQIIITGVPSDIQNAKKTIIKSKKDVGTIAVDAINKIRQHQIENLKQLPTRTTQQSRTVKNVVAVEQDDDMINEDDIINEDEPEVVFKQKTSRKSTKLLPTYAVQLPYNPSTVVGDATLGERLPVKQYENLKMPEYILNDRQYFMRFINSLLRKYKMNDSSEGKITCDTIGQDSANRDYLNHQLLVRDYLKRESPYRGLLLYHGLGSGKTCSSIAIAEGMKSSKQIIVMLPASLQQNYVDEIKKCGDLMFRRNQYWEQIQLSDVNDDVKQNLSNYSGLSLEYLNKKKYIWMSNAKKQPNINALTSDQMKSLNIQIEDMIRSKYKFINYNGLTRERFAAMTDNFTKNIFNDSTVIIDEAHNMISRIVNKLNKKEARNSAFSLVIYTMLMEAKNARIVLLTGTPIVNYPNEIGILFNILRGTIKTWSFKLIPKQGTSQIINQEYLKNALSESIGIDYMKYTPTSQTLVVTRNPFGFINKYSHNRGEHKYKGVEIDDRILSMQNQNVSISENYVYTDEQFEREIVEILKKNNVSIIPNQTKVKENVALPDTLDEFFNVFIDTTGTIKLKNSMKFKQRVMGLTSYFRSAQEELLPRYDKMNANDRQIVRINMSIGQFNLYAGYRKQERDTEKNTAKSNAMNAGKELYKQQSSTYRLMSRLACNIAIPNRPNPVDFAKLKRAKRIEESEEGKESEEGEESKNENKNEKPLIKSVKKLSTIVEEPSGRSKSASRTRIDPSAPVIEPSKPKSRSKSVPKERPTQVDVAEEEPTVVKKSIRKPKTITEVTQQFVTPRSATLTNELNKYMSDHDVTDPMLKSKIMAKMNEFEDSNFFKLKKKSYDELPEKTRTPLNSYINKYVKTMRSSKASEIENMSFNDYFDTQVALQKAKMKTAKGGSNILKHLTKNDEDSDVTDGDDSDSDSSVESSVGDDEIMFGGAGEGDGVTDDEELYGELPEDNVEKELMNVTDQSYAIAVQRFMELMQSEKYEKLNMENLETGLMKYSPKYYEMIHRIANENNIGLHLLYSQFRNVEGLALFGMALDVNGFQQFKIKKTAGVWDFDPTFNFMTNQYPCYAFYTGEETSEERQIIRNIYNGDWNDVPEPIRGKLMKKTMRDPNGKNNNYGQVIKLLMITAAGAEGINLRNTRFVHIMEPYWHPVRTEQVIGRARRICSHKNLPLELQTVTVFMYISVMTDEQLASDVAVEINKFDMPEITLQSIKSQVVLRPETSDEKLLSISTTKENVAESILKAIKESSIDCSIHLTASNKEGLTCLSYATEDTEEYSYTPDYANESNYEHMTKEVSKTYKTFKLPNGKQVALDTMSNMVYDVDDIRSANPTPIGRIEESYKKENGQYVLDENGNKVKTKSIRMNK